MLTKVKKKPDSKDVIRSVTTGESTALGPDPLETKGSDPLAKLAKSMDGPSSLTDDVMAGSSGILDKATQLADTTTPGQAPPEVGGGGTDPLRWVLGTQAPTVGDLRGLTREAIKEAIKLNKSAPKTDENKAFLDAARRMDNEIGQFGALTSLARFSGNWQWCGIHAAGQLLEALAVLAQMAQALMGKEKGNPLAPRAQDYSNRVTAGRQNFYGRNAPFAQKASGLAAAGSIFD